MPTYSPLHLPHYSLTLPRQDFFSPCRPLPQEVERASVGIRLLGGEAGDEHGRSRKGRWGRDGRQGGRCEGGGCGCGAWSSALARLPNELFRIDDDKQAGGRSSLTNGKSGDGDDVGVTSYFTMNEIRTKIVSISAHQHVISPFTESFQLVLSSPS